MAKDDYPVIAYQVLAYLYHCLKGGLPVEASMLQADGKLFQINERYWAFILTALCGEGFITGLKTTPVYGRPYPLIDDLEGLMITPRGIEYLSENSWMQKTKDLLKDAKSILPFM